jgi:hypothetical protein
MDISQIQKFDPYRNMTSNVLIVSDLKIKDKPELKTNVFTSRMGRVAGVTRGREAVKKCSKVCADGYDPMAGLRSE